MRESERDASLIQNKVDYPRVPTLFHSSVTVGNDYPLPPQLSLTSCISPLFFLSLNSSIYPLYPVKSVPSREILKKQDKNSSYGKTFSSSAVSKTLSVIEYSHPLVSRKHPRFSRELFIFFHLRTIRRQIVSLNFCPGTTSNTNGLL